MKKIILPLVFLTLVASFFNVPSSSANSQDFTIGVYIPAIPGVNVPLDDPNADIYPWEKTADLQTDVRDVERDGITIRLQTILVK
jgi:hypothetical protein